MQTMVDVVDSILARQPVPDATEHARALVALQEGHLRLIGRIRELERDLDALRATNAILADTDDDDEESEELEHRPASLARPSILPGLPAPGADGRSRLAPIEVDWLATATATDIRRAIANRHSERGSERAVADALANSPRFAHWRILAGRHVCGRQCRACADGTSVQACHLALSLLARPFNGYLTRYSAIMAGEQGASLVSRTS